MSYIPTEWHKGDVVTAAKLNKLEQGVGASGTMVVDTVHDEDTGDYSLSETAGTIYAHIQSGEFIVAADFATRNNVQSVYYYILAGVMTFEDMFVFTFKSVLNDNTWDFGAMASGDYPNDRVDPRGGDGDSPES